MKDREGRETKQRQKNEGNKRGKRNCRSEIKNFISHGISTKNDAQRDNKAVARAKKLTRSMTIKRSTGAQGQRKLSNDSK